MELAARMGAWAKSGYTAKDYVQDGLIAMWDGIENAGWGVHAPNATVWKDLSGNGYDFSFIDGVTGATWEGGDHLYLAHNNKSSIGVASTVSLLPITDGGDCTVEEIYDLGEWVFFDNIANSQMPFRLFGAAVPVGRFNHSGFVGNSALTVAQNMTYAYRDTLETRTGLQYRNAMLTQGSTQLTLCVGDSFTSLVPSYSEAKTFTVGDAIISRPPFCNAKLYSVRVYDRVLTDAEVSHNYAIDKARFGLPDVT